MSKDNNESNANDEEIPCFSIETICGTNWQVELLPKAIVMPKRAASDKFEDFEGDILLIAVYSEDFAQLDKNDIIIKPVNEKLIELDKITSNAVTDILAKGDFNGYFYDTAIVRVGGKMKNFGMFGLGKKENVKCIAKWGKSIFERFGEKISEIYKYQKYTNIGITFTSMPSEKDLEYLMIQKIITGISLGAYRATRYKENKSAIKLNSIVFYDFQEENIIKGANIGNYYSKGIGLTRYLVESPANVVTPQYLADTATYICEKFADYFTLKVLEKDDCKKMGMGSYLAVSEGSELPPKFIHLIYSNEGNKDIALIGKGITHDTGGYNIKSAGSLIDRMKYDMGGSAAVLGAAYIIGNLKPKGIRIHFIIAACENMISGKAYRPGDIIKAMNGKSIEVVNTDCEGRLTLADALLYAQTQCNAVEIIDIATLTGSQKIALGLNIAAMMSPSEEMVETLEKAAKISGEKIWRLPLEEEYLDEMRSGIADLKNSASGYGGCIKAGLFLKEFVNINEVKWSHLDIAGPAYNEKKGGATGYGTALLTDWAISRCQLN